MIRPGSVYIHMRPRWSVECDECGIVYEVELKREAEELRGQHFAEHAALDPLDYGETCCHLHKPVGCCDANDCGPCCENCPTCPTLNKSDYGGLPDA